MFVCIMASVLGFALFVYGKKQKRLPQLVVGVVLMIFPYFISGALLQIGISAGLLALMVVAIRLGV